MRGVIESSLYLVLFCELPVVQISLNEAWDDDKTENENVHECEHAENQENLPSFLNQQFYEQENKGHNKEA